MTTKMSCLGQKMGQRFASIILNSLPSVCSPSSFERQPSSRHSRGGSFVGALLALIAVTIEEPTSTRSFEEEAASSLEDWVAECGNHRKSKDCLMMRSLCRMMRSSILMMWRKKAQRLQHCRSSLTTRMALRHARRPRPLSICSRQLLSSKKNKAMWAAPSACHKTLSEENNSLVAKEWMGSYWNKSRCKWSEIPSSNGSRSDYY